jgi:hypothetical protein
VNWRTEASQDKSQELGSSEIWLIKRESMRTLVNAVEPAVIGLQGRIANRGAKLQARGVTAVVGDSSRT